MKTLNEISQVLKAALASDAMFGLVNSRIAIRTGIDLTQISVGQDTAEEAVSKVLVALNALGFSPDALRLVAQRKR